VNSDHQTADKGVRAVATLEMTKGVLTLLAGFGVLSLLHENVQCVAEELVTHLHLNPASHYPRVFIDLSANATDSRLWMMAIFAFAYASIRFTEAYGLWFYRAWAEWFAALSGAVYLPFEVYELFKGVSGLKLATLTINLVIVAFMSRVLILRYSDRILARKIIKE
jgi:uncharacterized membrane protein (DUF2068 family)